MNALTALKKAIRDGVELVDPTEIYELGIPTRYWPLIVAKLGVDNSPEDVKQTAEGKDLRILIKGMDKLLSLKSKYRVEATIGEKFSKDVLPVNFPWSVLSKLQEECVQELIHRRSLVIEALTLIAKDEIAKEMALIQEKEDLAKVPKLPQKRRRKTLAMYRAEARKLLKEKEQVAKEK